MARKKGGGGGRQRARQRQQYDELDKYPVMPPHAFARIVRDKQTLNIIYQIIEPPLTKKEQEQRDEIMDIFIRSLTANIEEIDSNPEAYVRTAMDKVIKSYSMKINKKSKSKLFYYLRRDLIGYGKMDVLMNDVNVRTFRLTAPTSLFLPTTVNLSPWRRPVFGKPMRNWNRTSSSSPSVVESTSRWLSLCWTRP